MFFDVSPSTSFFLGWKENFGEALKIVKDGAAEMMEASFSILKEGFAAINSAILSDMTAANMNWSAQWGQLTQRTQEACQAIVSAVSAMVSQVQSLCNALSASINATREAAASLSGIRIPSGASASGASKAVQAGRMFSEIPALASGSVIRGGNPFLAVLGDQPAGKVNVEAPAVLIKDMVKQGIAEAGYGMRGTDAVPVNINLSYDGQNFARLSIPDT